MGVPARVLPDPTRHNVMPSIDVAGCQLQTRLGVTGAEVAAGPKYPNYGATEGRDPGGRILTRAICGMTVRCVLSPDADSAGRGLIAPRLSENMR
jgi:hypothetical protein